MTGRKAGGFHRTCDLLNRYLKERNGSIADLSLGMARALAADQPDGTTEAPPRTMNLLPGFREEKEEEPTGAQMTIFYGGKVMVFENFPPNSAREILAMAGRLRPLIPLSSELPIARRASLNRFLEKRKDRISSRAPYQVPASSSSALSTVTTEEVKRPWLGLTPLSSDGLAAETLPGRRGRE